MKKDPEENHAGNQITWIPPGSFVLYGHVAWEHGCCLEPAKKIIPAIRTPHFAGYFALIQLP